MKRLPVIFENRKRREQQKAVPLGSTRPPMALDDTLPEEWV
jgi:hypothetical protein